MNTQNLGKLNHLKKLCTPSIVAWSHAQCTFDASYLLTQYRMVSATVLFISGPLKESYVPLEANLVLSGVVNPVSTHHRRD